MSLNIQSTTYAGMYAKDYINAALLSARSLSGGVNMRTNVKNKQVIHNFTRTGEILQDSVCDFTPIGSANTNEVILETVELQTQDQFCKEDLHNDWQSMFQNISAHDNIPQDFLQYIIYYYAGLIAEATEQTLWQGATHTGNALSSGTASTAVNLRRYNGLIKRIAQATDSTKIATALTTAEAAAIASGESVLVDGTAAAIKGEWRKLSKGIANLGGGKVYSNMPSNLFHYISIAATEALVDALGSTDNGLNNQQQTWWTGGSFNGLRYNGVPIFVAPGMERSTVISTYKANLWFGTGLMADYNEVKVKDMGDVLLDRNVRISYRFTAGTQVGNTVDTHYYKRPNKA